MSLQQPQAMDTLFSRQRANEAYRWKWVVNQRPEACPCGQQAAACTCGVDAAVRGSEPCRGRAASVPADGSMGLRDALHDAMQSHLGVSAWDRPLRTADDACCIKTSDSHPINVSAILPQQLLPSLSAQVMRALPPAFAAIAADNGCSSDATPAGETLPPEMRMYVMQQLAVPRSEAPEHLASALRESRAHLLAQVRGEQLIRLPCTVALDELIDALGERQDSARVTPPPSAASSSPQLMVTPISRSLPEGDSALAKKHVESGSSSPTGLIGNLYLSSCPGKKVRLDGRMHGRGGICRDLKMDLARFRQMGIRTIVCCLDDDELEFLGCPCEEYLAEVQAQGLDLIRLPIAEGFAPMDIGRIDSLMSTLVLNYTLRGASILVHCRGGVGRAGIVACLWILKMGLVMNSGPSDGPCATLSACTEPPSASPAASDASACATRAANESVHVLQVVLKVIDIVRKRRSPKAIETAEQARFLVEYVRFLHQQEHAQKCYQAACGSGG